MLNTAAFGSSVVKLRPVSHRPSHAAESQDTREDLENLRRRLAQAELAAHETLQFSRELIREAADLIVCRSYETKDTFLRHHLNMVANDVTALTKMADEAGSSREVPCFYKTLSSETAQAMRQYPARFNPVSRNVRLLTLTPSSAAEAIFAHLVRYLLRAVVQCELSHKRIDVWLEQKGDAILLHLDGIKIASEQDLFLCVTYPKRVKALLGALDARLERSRDGAMVVIPLCACV